MCTYMVDYGILCPNILGKYGSSVTTLNKMGGVALLYLILGFYTDSNMSLHAIKEIEQY